MKIALISVSPEFISVGLRTLSSVLKEDGHEINLVFLAKDNNRSLTPKESSNLNNFLKDFDLVGLSLTTNYFEMAKDITLKIKDSYGNKPVVWGGMHATVAPDECLKYADFVCRGEGEVFLRQLA